MPHGTLRKLLTRETINQKSLHGRSFEKNEIYHELDDGYKFAHKPLTYIKQIIAGTCYPKLLKFANFPEDVTNRATVLLQHARGNSIGSYTGTVGLPYIREAAAKFLETRDGISVNFQNVLFYEGLSDGIRNILRMVNVDSGEKPIGVVYPIPHPAVYSRSFEEFGLHPVGYYLDEDKNWAIDIEELKKTVRDARNYCVPRVMVVVNPGNPTSQLLSRQLMEDIVRFAHEKRLFILADESHQWYVFNQNIPFVSFKKIICEMPDPFNGVELVAFAELPQAYAGRLLSAFAEFHNVEAEVKFKIVASVIVKMCPNSIGQVALAAFLDPPIPADQSCILFQKEKLEIAQTLEGNAKWLQEWVKEVPGMRCSEIQGTFYAFPSIDLPAKALERAKSENTEPDEFYFGAFYDNTGILLQPGYIFGEKPNSFHFRVPLFQEKEDFRRHLQVLGNFHRNFTANLDE